MWMFTLDELLYPRGRLFGVTGKTCPDRLRGFLSLELNCDPTMNFRNLYPVTRVARYGVRGSLMDWDATSECVLGRRERREHDSLARKKFLFAFWRE